MNDNAIKSKSKEFALRVIRMFQFLTETRHEFVLSKQVLRSGTSIGAHVREAQRAQSPADFAAKMYIALKEADESEYWLELLHEGGYLSDSEFADTDSDCQELIRLLVSITKSVSPRKPFPS